MIHRRAQLLEKAPRDAQLQYQLSKLLSMCPVATLRDVPRALVLAEQSVASASTAQRWSALGVAQYRAARFRSAVDSFNNADELFGDERQLSNELFLAMSYWQLDQHDNDKARDLHNAAAAETAAKPQSSEVHLIQREAAALIEQ